MLGVLPNFMAPAMKLIGTAVNRLPRVLREQIYIWSGAAEGIAPKKIHEASTDRIADWMTRLYPARKYPAVMLGSSNGALIHLCAAAGIPWLPQTALVPVRRSGIPPDEPTADMQWAKPYARRFLDANPGVSLHHMFDPNQDQLMIRRMTYFRFKHLELPPAYARFLEQVLEPGGTIFIVDCRLTWPTTQCGDRHFFQFGAPGGATVAEYFQGGPRVAAYLSSHGSPRTRWNPPAVNGETPEAEWGFDPRFGSDIMHFARKRGYRVKRIAFSQPEDTTALVADLYAWWHRQRGISERRLLVESFIVMEPYWTIRTGAVPYWMFFNSEQSAAMLGHYLDERPGFAEIYAMLFSHGVESVGVAPIDTWRDLLRRATRRGRFVGVDESAYPRDFAVYTRYHSDLVRTIDARYPMPAPLSLDQIERFLAENNGRYPVQWGWDESVSERRVEARQH
ncbi:MAG: hypothetical protein ACT4PS_14465 [Betaproteobacteria bacterium]